LSLLSSVCHSSGFLDCLYLLSSTYYRKEKSVRNWLGEEEGERGEKVRVLFVANPMNKRSIVSIEFSGEEAYVHSTTLTGSLSHYNTPVPHFTRASRPPSAVDAASGASRFTAPTVPAPESIENPPHTARMMLDVENPVAVEGRPGGGGGKACRGSQFEARRASMRRVCGRKLV
jgi:hypothetical protein